MLRKSLNRSRLLLFGGSVLGSAAVVLSTSEKDQQSCLRLLPTRLASRLWGAVHQIDLPVPLRAPLYNAWTVVFDCKLDEMKYPLDHYKNLGEFFSRPLKDGARTFIHDASSISSPVDGTVATIGVVDSSGPVPLLEQVKGVTYTLDGFLGSLPDFFNTKQNGTKKRMYHCVLYLAPGDYHRIHSPIDWSVVERRHFPGALYPVNQRAVNFIPNLFVENERVALLGSWKYGFFSLTAVGATNVGSIAIEFEPELHTNVSGQGKSIGQCFSKCYENQHMVTRGDQTAQFKLGSTVVLVFEAPENFEFTIQPGDKLTLGKTIGVIGKEDDKSIKSNLDDNTFPSTSEMLRLAETQQQGEKSHVYMKEISRTITKVVKDAVVNDDGIKLEKEKIEKSIGSLGSSYSWKK